MRIDVAVDRVRGLDEVIPAGSLRSHIVEVEITPPNGRERLFAIWSAARLGLNLQDLEIETRDQDSSLTSQYRATRQMLQLTDHFAGLPADEWRAVALELGHH